MNKNSCNIPFIFMQLVLACIYYLPTYILNLHLLKGLVRTLQMLHIVQYNQLQVPLNL